MESSRALPNGVVTFLMTDIEGSTRLWEREPEAMRKALLRHDELVAAAVQQRQGDVVKSRGEGDSIFAVFQHVRDAVGAALAAQSALAVQPWTTSTPLRVRMAVHTGQIELRDGDYYGPTVNRCARLRSLAAGGQVLLSGVTAQLTQGQLPGGASLKDLGTHALKGLAAPEHVWQLVHPQMPIGGSAQAEPRPAVLPKQANHRAYKLTDHLNRSTDGREWFVGDKCVVAGFSIKGEDTRIRCYTSPILAGLLNGLNERFRLPRLWEATVDVDIEPHQVIVACREVTTLRQIALPTLTAQQHARFAVLCARAAYEGAEHEREFCAWADGWLAGQDSSGMNARDLADELEAEAGAGSQVKHPEHLMAADAARAAMHASRVSWLAGRAREDEIAQALKFATEAVRTALRITQLDLPTLASEVVSNGAAPVASTRPPITPVADRILKALPT